MAETTGAFPTYRHKARNWADKTRWGYRTVGLTRTIRGLARMVLLHLHRPERSEVRLRSGQVLEFAFPSQVPSALLVFGDYIDPEFAFLTRLRLTDCIVADVGAAIGQFTVFAATLPASFIHAFEPSAANAEALLRNVQRNRVGDRVTIHKIAFSEAESEAYFQTSPNTWLSALSDTGTERVCVRTLAAEFERLGLDHVAVLKINVAGFEPKVLEGAEPFLARGGADILILLLGLGSLPWYARLAGYGYRFFYFYPAEITLYEVTAFDASAVLDRRPSPARNIIAIHGSVVGQYVGTAIAIRSI
jgi:FkbM family methyltransferase